MQLRLLLAALLVVPAFPALGCSLTLGTAGTLALSADGTRLESTVAGGVAATFTVLNLSLGEATVTSNAAGFAAGTYQTRTVVTCSG